MPIRVMKEMRKFVENSDNEFLQFYHNQENIKHAHALLTGPPGTPYSYGLFDFEINIPDEYPTIPPSVVAMTTSDGTVRFNPNIYASGKVCLSILGTWHGDSGEQWTAAQTILSLMSETPYHNEPGFEEEKDFKIMGDYNKKIIHETIRVAVCDRIELHLGLRNNKVTIGDSTVIKPFCSCSEISPFKDLEIRMFLWYYDLYIDIVAEESEKKIMFVQEFPKMRFEHSTNIMSGMFNYNKIRERLENIYQKILDESKTWIQQSQEWITQETLTSSNLRGQLQQIIASGEFADHMLIELENNNPFLWNISVIGPINTNYEGGMFRISIHFHNDFPEIMPRVRFLTNIGHPNVAPSGFPYYRVQRKDNIRQHLAEVMKLFNKEPNNSPFTHINKDAAKLYFGTESERKIYARKVRQYAERSFE
ncbi:hypothetical protein HK096_006499 [Nowakowskiella sp. JEL0078]|nr:hypothetical protein HK096_006499 [Nowakowskiella sp. JEL0078]